MSRKLTERSEVVESDRRARKADARRASILRAAATVFRDRGYDGASMEEIAERLDMAKGNLYYYFKNKQELLFHCQEHSFDRLIENAETSLASGDSADDKLRRVVVGHVVCVLDELDGASAHTDVRGLPEELRARILAKRDRYETLLRQIVLGGIRSSAFAATDPKMATRALLGALDSATRWYRPSGQLAPSGIGESFADLFLDGLRGRGAEEPKELGSSRS